MCTICIAALSYEAILIICDRVFILKFVLVRFYINIFADHLLWSEMLLEIVNPTVSEFPKPILKS